MHLEEPCSLILQEHFGQSPKKKDFVRYGTWAIKPRNNLSFSTISSKI